MENFKYHNPTKLVFGKNTLIEIGKEINKFDVKKVLLVYGKGSIHKTGIFEKVILALEEYDIDFLELGGVKPNPVLSKVHEGIELCKKQNIDGVLAVGGGSVIDSAKAIAAGYYYEGDIWDCFEGKGKAQKSLPIFTVLTISATGSEMNPLSVITNEKENKKWPFSAGESSYPRVSIIDPTLQSTLPREQTVNGAVDAISHLFEMYFDGAENTDVQDRIIEGIIKSVIKHSKILLNEPENYESRSQLAWSATLALNGLTGLGTKGGDWSTHALEHTLSALFDVSHGAGLSIMFPAWMKFVSKVYPEKFIQLGKEIFDLENSDDLTAERVIDEIKTFFSEIGTPVSLKEIGVGSENIEELAENASLKSPIGRLLKLKKEDFYKIYELAL